METKIFELPQDFDVHTIETETPIRAIDFDIARIAIAGFVRASVLAPHELSGHGDPLLLIDGEPFNDEDYGDNIAYFGFVYERSSSGFWLKGGQWEHMVDFSDERNPTIYNGNAVYPPYSPVVAFSEPIAYNQEEFEKAVRDSLA